MIEDSRQKEGQSVRQDRQKEEQRGMTDKPDWTDRQHKRPYKGRKERLTSEKLHAQVCTKKNICTVSKPMTKFPGVEVEILGIPDRLRTDLRTN